MAHEVETMFSARKVPWHGLGVVTEDALTAEDAIVAGGLDWSVSKRKLFTENSKGNKVIIKDRYAMVRDTDEKALGVVGSHYVPFQNREAFTFFDALVESGEAKYETAGSLREGRVVFLTAHVPKDILIAGEDAHKLYLILRTSHDGSKAIQVYVSPIRVVCMNTLALSLYGNNVRQRWAVQHISTVHGRLAEARDALKLTNRYVEEFTRTAERLVEVQMDIDEFEAFLTKVIPERPRTAQAIADIRTVYETSPNIGEKFKGTGWGALNALTEYMDWVRPARSTEGRWLATLDGAGAQVRNRATSLLLARAR